MKNFLTLLFVILLISGIQAQTENPAYDKELAGKFEGDDYGMKSYIFVLLKTGPAKIESKTVVDSLFAGHLQNIRRLAEAEILVLAGPLTQNDNQYRGIFILDVKTTSEAEELLQTDPAIKEKLLDAELFTWYGATALGEYLKVQEKITKFNF
ncbi:MAG: hypothetical protein EOM06_04655 [Sphingobacteriia bacterium]|nr:hypothetical protein [Sphingobacteriia bacterium]